MRPPLQFASFVQDTITDPCEVPDVRVFVGFLGQSSRGRPSAFASIITSNVALAADAQSRYDGTLAVAEAARNAVAAAITAGGGAAAAANAVDTAAAAALANPPVNATAAWTAGAQVAATAANTSVAAASALATEAAAAEYVASAAEGAVLDAYAALLTVTQAQRERWLRLYFTLDFKEYVDVREADIVYNERTSSQLLQRQATILWVRSDAEIWHARLHSHPVRASDFLRGPLAQSDQPVIRPVVARDIGVQEDPPSWGAWC